MTDITKVMKVIEKIKYSCNKIDDLEETTRAEYEKLSKEIENESSNLISDMESKYQDFKNKHFFIIENEIDKLVNLLRKDYDEEWKSIPDENISYDNNSYDYNETNLYELIDKINARIDELNNLDFDILVPSVQINLKRNKLIVSTVDGKEIKEYNSNDKQKESVDNKKPLKEIVLDIFSNCKRVKKYLNALVKSYDKSFNINEYKAHVKKTASAWLSEKDACLKALYSRKFNDLFIDENCEAISKDFFIQLEQEGLDSNVDIEGGTDKFNESITIGNISLLVENNPKHLNYIRKSPVLNKYMNNGFIKVPLILNLRDCGNILLNINEDEYGNDTVQFVNQLIIQFLLSFPANRIDFRLIDVDNKMEFSRFKSLIKINNNILLDGIVRDDRHLVDKIKDMLQMMFKIEEDILSFNNVSDIYEYNKSFDANPQSAHLFVLVNFPSGMRDDIAKNVLKLVQNGNKEGIYTIIINNKKCPLLDGYKKEQYDQFIAGVSKNSLVINKNYNDFFLDLKVINSFYPNTNIDVSKLSSIIEMLKDNSETDKKKVISLSQMFSDSDASNLKKNIPSSAEVMEIPIGARGGEIQTLRLTTTGDGAAHTVVIGGTGSGKSNLLHTIIMNACYKYSPEELNLYIVDFKGGVEFKYYEANKAKEKQLPHIKLIGLSSDLEDGLAILNNLHKEITRRENEFRRCGVEDISHYRKLDNKLPSILVIIDEIQELFESNETLGQKAIEIISRFFKKGRAFGIYILWASQNVPKAYGLKTNVLSQIGNKISLRLNDSNDASDIGIDPKVVKSLNRPEKGLAVINDIRYGNDAVEFRVAYAESSENRQNYSQQIIDKWSNVKSEIVDEPLYIVGSDEEPSPLFGGTIYNEKVSLEKIKSKAFDIYQLQIGQDYVSGKPYNIDLSLRENNMNMLIAGYDIEIVRDMMGYSLLSTVMNHMTNEECLKEGTKIYYANGEMINPNNSSDLFNVIREDYSNIIENVSSKEGIKNCIKNVYKIYKQRSAESDASNETFYYSPYFVVIHSIQRFIDLFNESQTINFGENVSSTINETITSMDSTSDKNKMNRLFSAGSQARKQYISNPEENTNLPDVIFFSNAFNELLKRGGIYGIHFIISIDNPLGIHPLREGIMQMMYKVFSVGITEDTIIQLIPNYRSSNSLDNTKVAMVLKQNERSKVRPYRYDEKQDEIWYKKLCQNYQELWRK